MKFKTFVGRQQELESLFEFLKKSMNSESQCCFVAGDPGTGKTTLVNEFLEQASSKLRDVVSASASCYDQLGLSDPYLPYLQIMEILSGGSEVSFKQNEKIPGSKPKKFQGTFGRAILEFAPDLIGTIIPGSSFIIRAVALTAQETNLLKRLKKQKQRGKEKYEIDQHLILHQFTKMFESFCKEHPLIIVLDDLQWADNSSINLFYHLVFNLKKSKILFIGTYRPNDVALGRDNDRHPLDQVLNEIKRKKGNVWIDLNKKTRDEQDNFVSELIDSEPNVLPKLFREALLKHTNGNPLFTVELLRSLLERGNLIKNESNQWTILKEINWSILPSKVEGVIEERLNRLELELYDLLSMASVEGFYFTVQILAKLREDRDRNILRILSRHLDKKHRLVKESFLENAGKKLLSKYEFSHSLVQQYLYQQLSENEKIILHGEIANAIKDLYHEALDSVIVPLAYHFDKACEYEEAIIYFDWASSQALAISSYEEALDHTTRALEIVRFLPATSENDYLELNLQVRFSTIIRVLKGWSTPEAEAAHNRARDLCEALGDRPELFPILFGIWIYNLIQGDIVESNQVASQCVELANKLGDSNMIIQANLAKGNSLFWLAEFETSEAYIVAIFEMYDPVANLSHLVDYGLDPRLAGYMFHVWTPWLQGFTQTAAERNEKMLALANEINHPFSSAIVYTTAAWYYQFIRDAEKTRSQAQALIDLSNEMGFPAYLPWGLMLRGWALAEQGDPQNGYQEILKGARMLEENGGGLKSFLSILLAETCLHLSNPDQALTHIEIGMESVKKNQELPFEAELWNLKAQIIMDQSGGINQEAEQNFLRAIEIAENSGSRIYGLRALCNLVTLQNTQKKDISSLSQKVQSYLNVMDSDMGNPDILAARKLLDELIN